MGATLYDIAVEQGANFLLNVQVKDGTSNAVLTGYSARLQVRETLSSLTTLMEATTGNGYITINGPNGIVMVNVPADITTPMVWNTGVYDLEIYTSTTNVRRILKGSASLSPEVTHA